MKIVDHKILTYNSLRNIYLFNPLSAKILMKIDYASAPRMQRAFRFFAPLLQCRGTF